MAATYQDAEFQEKMKKLGLSLQYMDSDAYTKYARKIYEGEADSLKKLAKTMN